MFSQAQSLQMMLQQATGAVDGASMAQQQGQNATSGGVSMSLGAVMKDSVGRWSTPQGQLPAATDQEGRAPLHAVQSGHIPGQ